MELLPPLAKVLAAAAVAEVVLGSSSSATAIAAQNVFSPIIAWSELFVAKHLVSLGDIHELLLRLLLVVRILVWVPLASHLLVAFLNLHREGCRAVQRASEAIEIVR